jgi:hypothetical protein
MANKAIVGEKVGMTQVWDDANRVVPVTVVSVRPCRVVRSEQSYPSPSMCEAVTLLLLGSYGLIPRSWHTRLRGCTHADLRVFADMGPRIADGNGSHSLDPARHPRAMCAVRPAITCPGLGAKRGIPCEYGECPTCSCSR